MPHREDLCASPKAGLKALCSWWPKHLPTYVALMMGKENGWIGFSQPSYCCAEGQSAIRMVRDHGSGSPYGSLPLTKQETLLEAQFWAQMVCQAIFLVQQEG